MFATTDPSGSVRRRSFQHLRGRYLFEELRGLGHGGGYDAVRRCARGWQGARSAVSAAASVPLSFAPGEAYQFDWSHEVAVMAGAVMTVKVGHVRLCQSRMMFVRAYPHPPVWRLNIAPKVAGKYAIAFRYGPVPAICYLRTGWGEFDQCGARAICVQMETSERISCFRFTSC